MTRRSGTYVAPLVGRPSGAWYAADWRLYNIRTPSSVSKPG